MVRHNSPQFPSVEQSRNVPLVRQVCNNAARPCGLRAAVRAIGTLSKLEELLAAERKR